MPAEPLSVIIDYSKADDGWAGKIRARLSDSREMRVLSQRVEDTSVNDFKVRNALTEANVLVLLLSVPYLVESWMITTAHAPLISALEREGRLKVLPVLVHDCPWEQNAFLRTRQVFQPDGKPIGESGDRVITAVASRIEYLAHVSLEEIKLIANDPALLKSGLTTRDLEKFQISNEVARTLELARVLATFRETPLVTTTCLLFALAENGREPFQTRRTPQFLWQELSRRSKRYQEAFKEQFPRATNLTDAYIPGEEEITGNVEGVFKLASDISRRTYNPKPDTSDADSKADIGRVGARHLLAALLTLKRSPATGAQTILSTVTDVDVLRRRFLEFIIDSLPEDNHAEWDKVLDVKPKRARAKSERKPESELANSLERITKVVEQDVVQTSKVIEEFSKRLSPTPDEPPPTNEIDDAEIDLRPVLAGFATDYWAGKDLLNIENDVNALASLVSAWSVEPPLSIGLFGDWGSGKSHFMRQMRQRVETLSRKASKSPKKQNEIGYYKNIVQIEFNAWHYIEGNLWASLVDHIFANLRVSEKEKRSLVDARRDELMNKLGVKKEIESKLKSKIEEKQSQLKIKQKEATNVANNAEAKKDDISTQLAGFRSEAEKQLNELKVPLKVSDSDKELLERLGIKPEDWNTAADFRRHFDEVKGFRNRVAAEWKLFTTDRKVQRRVLLAAVITVIPLLGVVLPTVSQTVRLPAVGLTVLGALGTFLTAAVPIWKSFKHAFSTLEEHDAAVERERQKRIGDLQAEVTALTKTVLDAQTQAASIQNEIENLDDQIKSTTASQILGEFIEDRAAASDYRRHLGLLALIRRDFEKLRDLFNEQRQEERDGKDTHHQNRINRIILYIDDLDRCGPQRVVEVLQAIHLLLAFPIFVVVVGVDARWVTRSLQESYEWLHGDENEAGKTEDSDPDDQQNSEGATPHDYLEKIFQIPFWLRPMEEDQAKTFIKGLTEQVRYRPPVKPEPEPNGDKKAETDVDLLEAESRAAAEPVATNGDAHAPVVEAVVEADNGLKTMVESDETGVVKDTSKDLPSDAAAPAVEGDAIVGGPINVQGSVFTSFVQVNPPEEREDAEDKSPSTDSEADDEEHEDDHEESIDLAPQSLTLGDKEIEYMTALAKLIGRSPRAIKRFLNCYRLIKVSLPPAKLREFVQDGKSYEYKAVMILLGIVTGAPKVSMYVIEEIENWRWQKPDPATMHDFLTQLKGNVELQRSSDWKRLNDFLETFSDPKESAATFAALKAVSPRVSRFSFRIARTEAAGPKRRTAARSKKASASTSRSKQASTNDGRQNASTD